MRIAMRKYIPVPCVVIAKPISTILDVEECLGNPNILNQSLGEQHIREGEYE
jgi:hypothetical protein